MVKITPISNSTAGITIRTSREKFIEKQIRKKIEPIKKKVKKVQRKQLGLRKGFIKGFQKVDLGKQITFAEQQRRLRRFGASLEQRRIQTLNRILNSQASPSARARARRELERLR